MGDDHDGDDVDYDDDDDDDGDGGDDDDDDDDADDDDDDYDDDDDDHGAPHLLHSWSAREAARALITSRVPRAQAHGGPRGRSQLLEMSR